MMLLHLIGLVGLAVASCPREQMYYAVDYYVWSQTQAQIGLLPVIHDVPYTENRKNTSFISGIIGHYLPLDWNATFYDSETCTAFAELISTAKNKTYTTEGPTVVGMRFQFTKMKGGYDGKGGDDDLVITRMDGVVTRTGDWLFNATNSLAYYSAERPWDTIPGPKRDSRATLKAAADAYADRFANTSVVVPLGTPCCRIEGGASTCTGANETMLNTCTKGFPDAAHPQQLRERTYVIDQEKGVVQVTMNLAGLPDSHLFRIEEGMIRAVHTMTACGDLGCRIGNETLKRDGGEGVREGKRG